MADTRDPIVAVVISRGRPIWNIRRSQGSVIRANHMLRNAGRDAGLGCRAQAGPLSWLTYER